MIYCLFTFFTNFIINSNNVVLQFKYNMWNVCECGRCCLLQLPPFACIHNRLNNGLVCLLWMGRKATAAVSIHTKTSTWEKVGWVRSLVYVMVVLRCRLLGYLVGPNYNISIIFFYMFFVLLGFCFISSLDCGGWLLIMACFGCLTFWLRFTFDEMWWIKMRRVEVVARKRKIDNILSFFFITNSWLKMIKVVVRVPCEIDDIYCQRLHCEWIVEAGGDYKCKTWLNRRDGCDVNRKFLYIK